MKKFFTKNVWMLLCASVLLFGCDEHDYDAAEFFAFPVISASVEGATKTEISRDNMTIRVIYDEVVDVTQVPLEVELEPGVTFVTPSSASETFDLTEPQSLVLSSGNRLITYTVSAVFDIDTSEPIETFTASAPTELYGDKEGVVEIDNGVRTITITFDYVVDLKKVNVGYTFFNESDITDATPGGEWDLSDAENPKEFSFKVRGLEVLYLVRAVTVVDTSAPITSFTPSVGSVAGTASINNTDRKIDLTLFITGVSDLANVTVNYTLQEDVTVLAPTSTTWNLSQPVTFRLDVRGEEVSYTATVAGQLSLITNNIPDNVKLYKLDKWKGETSITAYAVVINSTGSAKLSVVGEGYKDAQKKTMSQYVAANPDAKFVITGSSDSSLLVVNGVIKQNVVSKTDGDGCLSIDANHKFYSATSTNRTGGTVDGAFGNTIYWWDTKAIIPAVYTAGKGGGHLNANYAPGNGLIPTGQNTKEARLVVASDANLAGNNAYFFVCQKGNGSDGMVTDDCIRILLALGAKQGFPVSTGDRNTYGLTVNGQVLVKPTTEVSSGYAYIIK